MVFLFIYSIHSLLCEFKLTLNLSIMSVSISYNSSSIAKKSSNFVFFVNEKFDLLGLKKYVSKKEYKYIYDLTKVDDKSKKIISFHINSKKK